jgi:hypothetical protein
MWSTLTHWGTSANGSGQGEAGYITVTHCSRRALGVTWVCVGTFRVDDPYDGERIARDVRVPNDFQQHSVGDQVGVDLIRHDRIAYYWDFQYAAEVFLATVGALLCLGGGVGILIARRRRTGQWATAIALLGLLLVLPVVLSVVGLTHTAARIDDNGPPEPVGSSASPGP